MPTVLIHRTVQLPGEQVSADNPAMTTPARSLVDAARWAASDHQAQLILFAGCQQRLATPQQISRVVVGLSQVFRRALILKALADIEGGVTALSELDFVKLCELYRLPKPELQVKRRDASGRIRYLDAHWPRWRLQVEIDGAHHMDVLSWEDDMCRQNALWLAGDRLLRFTARQVRARPQIVAAQVRAALEAAGWNGVVE
jgi:very-short-patch-repair endonuclease